MKIVLEILSTYIKQGILSQKQVDKHITIDRNQHIIISSEMQLALGKELPQLEISEKENIFDEWQIP